MDNKDKTLKLMTESEVVTSDNLDGYVGKIGDGWFVRSGYINSADVRGERRYVNQDNLERLKGYQGQVGSIGKKFLGTSVEDSDAWMSNTNPKKNKTVTFNFGEGISIVEYTEYEMNWYSNEKVAKIERNKFDKILALRKKYGFDGSDDANNSWRGKSREIKSGEHAGEKVYTYGNGGLMPDNTNKPKGTPYIMPSKDSELNLWTDPETGKRAYRQSPRVVKRVYVAIDAETGEVEKLPDGFVEFLSTKFGRPAVKKTQEELEADEQAYKNELAQIENENELKSAWSLLEDKTLWMSYTIQMPDGSKRPSKTWKNDALKKG